MNRQPVRVGFARPFTTFLKRLRKKYPHIQDDLQPLFNQLADGETPGDQVPGLQHAVYKVRVRNSDIQKGKSGGYRVLYYLKTDQ
jgi:mRNA-degrading endonuclease RelE of RelBE toxin-antitoxin system